jgi:DNA-binding NtrC family response regulator
MCERVLDLPYLVQDFLEEIARERKIAAPSLREAELKALGRLDWTGLQVAHLQKALLHCVRKEDLSAEALAKRLDLCRDKAAALEEDLRPLALEVFGRGREFFEKIEADRGTPFARRLAKELVALWKKDKKASPHKKRGPMLKDFTGHDENWLDRK